MPTEAQKVDLLGLLKEGRGYVAVGRCYGMNESLVLLHKEGK